MTQTIIEQAIPHRAPMLLVDEVIARSESEITCRKTFREDEFFVQGHYPHSPIVPGVILCEVAMQSGAILLADKVEHETNKVPVVTRMNNVKFKRKIVPGETAEVVVTLKEMLSGAFFMSAKVYVDSQVAVVFEFACTLA